MALALVMGGMQPTIAATPAAATLLQTPAPPPPPETALWWHSAGDAVLDQLIERGLATDKPLACEAQALHRDGGKARTRDKRLDRRIARLFGAAGAEADSADLQARAYDYADHRARLAARIAATYLDVRRLQEIATLRRKMQAQFKDNAEIARFRREAGLVDGLDVGLAGSLVAINGSSLDADRQTFEDKARELADLTGMDETTLLASLGEEGKVPRPDDCRCRHAGRQGHAANRHRAVPGRSGGTGTAADGGAAARWRRRAGHCLSPVGLRR
ncbi:hypothetical protein ACFSTD_17815 [Novosphingobium colocasiae]